MESKMNIKYTEEKNFTQEQAVNLFKSVGWQSADYPTRLYKALENSSTVVTAWCGKELVGLVRVLDDSEMVAFIHYLIVNPKYQGNGIANHLMSIVKDKYKDYLYLEVMPDQKKNVPFYKKQGFNVMEDGTAMNIVNENNKY